MTPITLFNKENDAIRLVKPAARTIAGMASAGLDPVTTRFVPYSGESGSWSSYYDRWSSMRRDPSDRIWDPKLPGLEVGSSIDLPTFTKWGEAMAGLILVGGELIHSGVATDCCVLSTAPGAVDAGRYVTVVEDACAGQKDEAHEQAIRLMQLLSPMIHGVHRDSLL